MSEPVPVTDPQPVPRRRASDTRIDEIKTQVTRLVDMLADPNSGHYALGKRVDELEKRADRQEGALATLRIIALLAGILAALATASLAFHGGTL